MTIEHFLEKNVEVQLKRSKHVICKGKVVQVYGENHLYVLPEGLKNTEDAMGFAADSVLFDIKIL